MSGCAVSLLFSLSCREMLSVGPECGPHKVLCGQGGALGGAGLSPSSPDGFLLPPLRPAGGSTCVCSSATGYSKGGPS